MPLHKPKCVGLYHQQLAYCVTQVTCATCFSLLHAQIKLGHSVSARGQAAAGCSLSMLVVHSCVMLPCDQQDLQSADILLPVLSP